MKRVIALAVAALLSCGVAYAQMGSFFPGPGTVHTSTGCTAATNFLARTSGLSGTESTAYTTMICGLVTDGIITGNLSGATGCGTVLDGLFIFATNTTTTANLNLCGTSYGLTQSGTVTFTADQGYTGAGGYLTSTFVPSTAGGVMTQNSAHIFTYVLNARTTQTNMAELGSANNAFTNILDFNLVGAGASTEIAVNDGKPGYSLASSTQGAWVASRTGASAGLIRRNAAVFATIAATSTGLPDANMTILALTQTGSGQVNLSTDQVAATAWGAALTTTAQMDALANRVNAFMLAVCACNVY